MQINKIIRSSVGADLFAPIADLSALSVFSNIRIILLKVIILIFRG